MLSGSDESANQQDDFYYILYMQEAENELVAELQHQTNINNIGEEARGRRTIPILEERLQLFEGLDLGHVIPLPHLAEAQVDGCVLL